MPLITYLPSIIFSIRYAIALLTFSAIVVYYTHRGYSCRHTGLVLCCNDSLHCHAGAGNDGGMQVLQKLQGWVLRVKSGWFQAICLRLGGCWEEFGYVRAPNCGGQLSQVCSVTSEGSEICNSSARSSRLYSSFLARKS